MNITLEQLFYGRGARGYAILGVSPGAAELAVRVEALCGAVGTPIGDYGGEPFLLSVPDGGRVVMVCGRRGAPDSMGRATLFFHALIAAKADLAAVNADAFSLFAQGAFADKMPQGEIGTVNLRMDAQARQDATDSPVAFPAVYRSPSPALELVCGALGGRTLDLRWATFAFQALPDFDVQVLPPRTSCPRTLNEYGASGKLLRASAGEARPPDRPPMDGRTQRKAQGCVPPQPRSPAMLKFSIALNLVLVAVCAVLLASRKTTPESTSLHPNPMVVTNVVDRIVEKKVEIPLSPERKAEIEREAVMHLKEKFNAGMRVSNFEEEKKVLPKSDDILTDVKYKDAKGFLAKLRAYVDFVNKEILEENKP